MPRPTARLGRARGTVRRALLAATLAILAGGAVVLAAGAAGTGPATVSHTATRVDPGLDDVASMFDLQDVDPEVVAGAFAAAEQAGGAAAPARTASVGLRAITRGGSLVHAAPDGYLIPMVLIAMRVISRVSQALQCPS